MLLFFAPKPSITIPNHRFPSSILKICCSPDGEQKRAHVPPLYLWISHLKNILFSSMFTLPTVHVATNFPIISAYWADMKYFNKIRLESFQPFLTQLFPSYYSVLLLKVRNKWNLPRRLFNKPVCWQGAKILLFLFVFKMLVLQYLRYRSDSRNTQNPAELLDTVYVLSS